MRRGCPRTAKDGASVAMLVIVDRYCPPMMRSFLFYCGNVTPAAGTGTKSLRGQGKLEKVARIDDAQDHQAEDSGSQDGNEKRLAGACLEAPIAKDKGQKGEDPVSDTNNDHRRCNLSH